MPRGRRKKPFKLKLKPTTVYTFSSVGLFCLAGIISLSFSRQGPFLTKLWLILHYWFGWGIVFLPFLFLFAGLILARLKWRLTQPNVLVGSSILLVAFISLTQSGVIGFEIWQNLAVLISGIGAFLVLVGFAFVGFVVTFDTSLEEVLLFFSRFFAGLKKALSWLSRSRVKVASSSLPSPLRVREAALADQARGKGKSELSLDSEITAQLPSQGQVWKHPPLSLLVDSVSGKADRGDIKKNAETIEKNLESFGISARVAEVNLGPTVTQYALEIALGTKLSKITALSTDLALALAAPTGQIRIEAPIPGRSLVGVEVPNHSPEFVTLKQMLGAEKLKKSKSALAVALGLNVSGEPVIDNLARMPHVLIAGATGSGKSVCIHSFIATILFRASPDEVKFIMVDPKRVELTVYQGIPHLLSPVIFEPKQVLSSLKWTIQEMDRRYKLFAEMGVRNIDSYNELSGFAAMPYILVIVDELADIIMFSPAEIEDDICRIAQMARATGIHLVISTQRPSVDVLTGLIKANIPCRIAFNVSSLVDSRVILDTPGAEKLLGRGDMLYIPPDQAKPTRIQGTFVSEPEVQKLVDFLKQSGIAPTYSQEVIQQPTNLVGGRKEEAEETDELFAQAVEVIRRYERASASLLQRRLKIGYARAARIIDQLEKSNLVSQADGSKPREVFAKNAEEYLASRQSL